MKYKLIKIDNTSQYFYLANSLGRIAYCDEGFVTLKEYLTDIDTVFFGLPSSRFDYAILAEFDSYEGLLESNPELFV